MNALRSSRAVALLALAIAFSLAACSGDASDPGAGSGVAHVTISGAPGGNTLLIGQSAILWATTTDREDNPVTGAGVSWKSSDTTRAKLLCGAESCRLTAVALGTSVITASAGGRSDSFTLTVAEVPAAEVRLTPSSAALYVGTSLQVQAVVLDSTGSALPGRTVTWKSSDLARALVDANGTVHALSSGRVTISATSGQRTSVVSLTVLPGVSADWSAVSADWTMYQGNALHTGYVPAMVDARVFRAAWTATVTAGVPAAQPTFGGGGVYVTAGSTVGAFDAATGAPRWTRPFSVYSLTQAAYADGSLYLESGGHEDAAFWGVNAADGALRFRSAIQDQWSHYYAPTVVGQNAYIGGGYYGGMYGFGTTAGAQQWFSTLNQYDEFTPAVKDGYVYAYTGSYAPKLTVADAGTGQTVYEIADPNFGWNGWSMDVAPVLGGSNDVLVTQAGRLLSFDLAARGIRWQMNSQFSGNVTVAEGVLYVINGKQVEARRESDGALLWTWVAPETQPVGSMVATRNLVFVSTAANVYAIDIAAHLQVWSAPVAGSLALGNQGVLVVARSNGGVAAFNVK